MSDKYCKHPAYCRDEVVWRKAIIEAENEAYQKAADTFKDEYSNYDDPLIGVMWGIKAILKLKQPT